MQKLPPKMAEHPIGGFYRTKDTIHHYFTLRCNPLIVVQINIAICKINFSKANFTILEYKRKRWSN